MLGKGERKRAERRGRKRCPNCGWVDFRRGRKK